MKDSFRFFSFPLPVLFPPVVRSHFPRVLVVFVCRLKSYESTVKLAAGWLRAVACCYCFSAANKSPRGILELAGRRLARADPPASLNPRGVGVRRRPFGMATRSIDACFSFGGGRSSVVLDSPRRCIGGGRGLAPPKPGVRTLNGRCVGLPPLMPLPPLPPIPPRTCPRFSLSFNALSLPPPLPLRVRDRDAAGDGVCSTLLLSDRFFSCIAAMRA